MKWKPFKWRTRMPARNRMPMSTAFVSFYWPNFTQRSHAHSQHAILKQFAKFLFSILTFSIKSLQFNWHWHSTHDSISDIEYLPLRYFHCIPLNSNDSNVIDFGQCDFRTAFNSPHFCQ